MIFTSDSAFSDIGQVAVVTAVTSTSVTVVAEIYTTNPSTLVLQPGPPC